MTKEIRVGLNNEISSFWLPGDYLDATLTDLLSWIPAELHDMPSWALQSMLGISQLNGFNAGSSIPLVKTTVFLTTTSGSNQTWTVLSDWNSSENTVEIVSHGGHGGISDADGGGGGGGYAKKSNISLTPSGSATFALRAGNSGAGTANACWFNGTSLAASSVGIQGAASNSGSTGGSGGVTTSGVGDTLRAGGNGGNGVGGSGSGGGGGAAGKNGVGGNGAAGDAGGAGGTGDNGTVSGGAGNPTGGTGSSGTEWDASHGSGGGGGSGDAGTEGGAGGLYGGGGGGGGTNGGTGQQGLIVIINNNLH